MQLLSLQASLEIPPVMSLLVLSMDSFLCCNLLFFSGGNRPPHRERSRKFLHLQL